MKKLTTEEFINKAVSLHKGRYDYSLVIYNGTSSKVNIICKVHGVFTQAANNHLAGQNCPVCGVLTRRRKQAKGLSNFILQANAIHNSKYDYSKVVYTTNKKKIIIICQKHGEFTQTPLNHLYMGCARCSREIMGENAKYTLNEFQETAIKVHGSKYIYLEYLGRNTPSRMFCTEHSTMFLQSPQNHLNRHSPECCRNFYGGFRRSQAGELYVLQSDDLVKIGITNLSAKDRAHSVSRSSGRVFSVVKTYQSEYGENISALEKTLIKELNTVYQKPLDRFEGYTECFYDVNIPKLLNRIEELIRKNYDY